MATVLDGDLYSCERNLGQFLYQLCDEASNQSLVQSSSAQGNTLTQAMVDDLLWEIKHDFNTTSRKEKTDLFQQWYMEQLLYDYPLLSFKKVTSIWSGFLGFDPREGVEKSIFLGADWNQSSPYLAYRSNDVQTFARAISFIGDADPLFDPGQMGPVVRAIFPSLAIVDRNSQLHPNIALSFSLSDWTNAPILNETGCDFKDCQVLAGSQVIPNGHLRFTLREDVNWTSFSGGAFPTSERVKPSGFDFSFTMHMTVF